MMALHMKIAYVVNARIPTEKAHGYQIMRTCLEWKKAGADVTLYVPRRTNHIAEDAFSFYGLEKNFDITYIRCTEWVRFARILGPLAFHLQSKSFLGRLFTENLISKDTLVYTRDAEAVSFFSKRGFASVYNAHNWPAHDARIKKLLKGVKGIVCNSIGTELAVREVLSVPTIVVHNAADANQFRGLGKSGDKKVVTYVGHLYGWKGTDIIIPLAESFKDDPRFLFQVIGGTPADLKKFSVELQKSGLTNVLLVGFKKKELVPKYLTESDVLLLPNAASSEESMRYTSPLKLFEYMASGVPIVASDLPSIRALLPENAGFYARPGDVASFAAAVRAALEPNNKGAAALKESEKYSWAVQARRALTFMQNL